MLTNGWILCWLCYQILKYRFHVICHYYFKHLPYLKQVSHHCALPVKQFGSVALKPPV